MTQNPIDKEIFAAISYALHQELGVGSHDQESYVLTIKRSSSPWALKIQAMRQLP